MCVINNTNPGQDIDSSAYQFKNKNLEWLENCHSETELHDLRWLLLTVKVGQGH